MTTDTAPSLTRCTVCRGHALADFARVQGKTYLRCGDCQATLMDRPHWPDPDQEKAVYDLHENDADDPGYQRFLAKLAQPLLARLRPGLRGLDFGCGPGPALASMLADAGMEMTLYDPIYRRDEEALRHRYDFITCTEVAEHLRDPAGTFAGLDELLRPGGWLAVMTCFQTDDRRFANWHYRRDPTHIVFYREATLAWLASRLGCQLEIPVKDVALFQKPA
ncbi:MAG: class I SAM-dependent methyltransferase [Marinobacter sp.]|uniref:class I SAM-dependent methyltransferase n=1 Tax=Marinobacter sp. TaxID=50741 RepID=UPI00299E7C7A|nr:class I SAM-dependent methyltransferase [Marinobacter sp.]MDX1634922.1 class I SAM-dependent methyltransferase [Marinobacter sp.]